MELNKNFGAKIAQRSYINPLDKAFEQLKFERNFSPRLWEDSIKNSQQNVLAALLEQNKGKTMRDEFYDPNYYDYDRMMTELYKDTLDDNIVFNNIPHRYLNQKVRFSVSCPNFVDTDTSLILTPNVTLNIERDNSVFGKVNFRIYNPNTEMYVGNTPISLAGQETVSDPNGQVSLFVPLEKQQRYYIITGPFQFENDTVYMPCGKDDVVLTQ